MMKKLIILLAFLIGFLAFTNAQGNRTDRVFLSDIQDTIKGEADYVIFYSPILDEYWDYSVQFKTALYGKGDSVYFGLETFQSNDPAQTSWTLLSSLNDTLLILPNHAILYSNSLLFEKKDFQGIWLAHKLTGIGLDTVIVKPYFAKKVKRYY